MASEVDDVPTVGPLVGVKVGLRVDFKGLRWIAVNTESMGVSSLFFS